MQPHLDTSALVRWNTDTHLSGEIVEHARRVLARLDLVPATNRLIDAAATAGPSDLRTLDAIHLAAALTAPNLRAIITYDRSAGLRQVAVRR
jgi:predicted nucleic acid-binding protein